MKMNKNLSLFLSLIILWLSFSNVKAAGPITLKLNKGNVLSTQSVINSQPVPLDFIPADSILDPSNPIVYLTDSARKRLYSFNYETNASSFIQFDLVPERLAVLNNNLYVTLLISGHEYYSQLPEKGAVSIINLDTFKETQRLKMNLDPYDIAVDRNGFIYLTPGSNQHNYIRSYSSSPTQDSILGYIKELSSASTYMEGLALLHPKFNKLYTISTSISPRDIAAFAFDEYGILGTTYDSPYHGDYPMSTVYKISPEGKYIFNGAGTVFSCSEDRALDMKYVLTLGAGFNDIAFDLETNSFFTASIGSANVDVYNYEGLTKKGSIKTSAECKYLFYRNDNLIAVTANTDKYSVEVIPVSSMEPLIDGNDGSVNMYGKVTAVIYDSSRNKAYAIDNGLNNLFIINLSSNTIEKTIKLPCKPSGICLSEDYSKVYIANDDLYYLITEVSLETYAIRTAQYTTEPNARDTAYKKIYQKAGKLFIITGEWAPKLLVFNSSTLRRLTSYPVLEEVGDLALSSDGSYLYTWRQYGWDAGNINSWLTKYDITQGTFIEISKGSNEYFQRDPLNTPILLLEEDGFVICKSCIFNIDDLSINAAIFPESIYAINSSNTIASSKKGLYDLIRDLSFQFVPEGEYDVKFFSNSGTLYLLENNSLYYLIPIPGDNNGDSFIDITDLAAAARSYNAKKGSNNFDVAKDLNYDDIIDIFDLVIVSRNLGY